MKRTIVKLFLSVFVISLAMVSCKTSNDVVTGNLIQKRKYNKGYFVNKPSRIKDKRNASNSEVPKNRTAAKEATAPATYVESPAKKNRQKAPNPEDELLASTGKSNVKTTKSVQETPAKTAAHRLSTEPVLKWPVVPVAGRPVKTEPEKSAGGDMNIMALLSFIFGLVGLLIIWIPYVGLISILFALAAIVLGFVSLGDGDIFAILGIVFGFLVVLLYIIVVLIVALVLGAMW